MAIIWKRMRLVLVRNAGERDSLDSEEPSPAASGITDNLCSLFPGKEEEGGCAKVGAKGEEDLVEMGMEMEHSER